MTDNTVSKTKSSSSLLSPKASFLFSPSKANQVLNVSSSSSSSSRSFNPIQLIRRKSSFIRNEETESLFTLSNESFRVAKEMQDTVEKKLTEIETTRLTSEERQMELSELLKTFQETDQIWRSVMKVLEEEYKSCKDSFVADRQEKWDHSKLSIDSIAINVAWVQLYQAEIDAVIAFENSDQSPKYSESYLVNSKLAMEKFTAAQRCWKHLLIALPHPQQTSIWNQRFEASINYSDIMVSFWSMAWKNALKCRYDTVLEMNKLKEASLLNKNNISTSSMTEVAETEYSLDKLIEYKNSEETIWDELIKTCQTIRSKFLTLPELNHYWMVLFQEIEFQKCYTLVEKSLVSVEILRYQISSYASYPLIKYKVNRIEKKRVDGRHTFLDVYEQIELLGADVNRIEKMCLLWKDLKQEILLRDEYCWNTILLYEQLRTSSAGAFDESEEALLKQHPSLLLASLKWKIRQAVELFQVVKQNHESFSAESIYIGDATVELEHASYKHNLTEKQNDKAPPTDSIYIGDVTVDLTRDSYKKSLDPNPLSIIAKGLLSEETLIEHVKKVQNLLVEINFLLEGHAFSTWKPESFKQQKLLKQEQQLNGQLYDYRNIPYFVTIMNVFLEKIDQFSKIKLYQRDLEEMLMGIPDPVKDLVDDIRKKTQGISKELKDIVAVLSIPQTPFSLTPKNSVSSEKDELNV